jgi:hypothetical protein
MNIKEWEKLDRPSWDVGPKKTKFYACERKFVALVFSMDYRCDDKRETLELGRHLGIIA